MLHVLLLKDLEYVKKESFYLTLNDLDQDLGLQKDEKEDLKFLIEGFSKISFCYYNSNGNIISIILDTYNNNFNYPPFPHLEHLKLFKATPSDLNLIKKCKKMRALSISSNYLKKIPDLSNLTNLEQLFLIKNKIIDFSWNFPLKKLWNLSLSFNSIKSLDKFDELYRCPNLLKLNLSHNKIVDLNNLRAISSLSSILVLNLSYNLISKLSLNQNIPNLKDLYLSDNNINEIIYLENLLNLEFLDLSDNHIIKLKNIKNLPKLTHLDCSNNPLKKPPEIENLRSFVNLEFTILSAEFKINDYLTLKLMDERTEVFVNNKQILICKGLKINLPLSEVNKLDQFNSIDDLEQYINSHPVQDTINIPPKTEFWGHCSNLQAWAEHNYDTRLIHSNIAFPLLRKLFLAGDKIAKRVFKEEIAKRYNSHDPRVIQFLKENGYLYYLNNHEIESLNNNS